ncbi:MAG: helix-turn-helix domain-containing protein [Gemmatimonadaceae bacterium]
MTEELLDTRARIIRAAKALLDKGGRDAVSTRAVSAAAGVQAPTIYRQFGDMRGLLDAVAHQALVDYVALKASLTPSDDAVADLRKGWHGHVEYGLANPAAYLLIYSDPQSLADAPAKREAEAMLLKLVTRVAEAGRLKVSVPHAAQLISSAGRGVVLSLIATPPAERDAELANAMCEAVMSAILAKTSVDQNGGHQPTENRVASRAVALRAVLSDAPDVLSPAEEHLLGDWLDRLATTRA